jgi:hypothetical protein
MSTTHRAIRAILLAVAGIALIMIAFHLMHPAGVEAAGPDGPAKARQGRAHPPNGGGEVVTAHGPQTLTPYRVTIPSIGIRAAPVVRLGLNGDGTLEVPTNFVNAGWWSGGTAPGRPGPAVIVGHVDSFRGPAVFYRLRDLRPGNAVVVSLGNGSVVRYIVQGSMEIPKTSFPTQRVYGAVPYPALRLVTCGGAFNHATGHYVDNVIVFARIG